MSKKKKDPEYKTLLRFYNEIRFKTSNNDVKAESACVTLDRLGESLEKVDKEWWRDADKAINK